MNERQKDEYRRLTGQPNKTKWAEDQSASPSSKTDIEKAFNHAVEQLGALFSGKQSIREVTPQTLGCERYRLTFSGQRFSDVNVAMHDLGIAIRALTVVETTTRQPDGYAYRRHWPMRSGETYIAFDQGGEINGSKPVETIPYWLGPALPTVFPKSATACNHANAIFKCAGCGLDLLGENRGHPERNARAITDKLSGDYTRLRLTLHEIRDHSTDIWAAGLAREAIGPAVEPKARTGAICPDGLGECDRGCNAICARALERDAVKASPPLEGSVLDRKVTICAACLCASCWQGEFYCDQAKTAGTVEKTVRELWQGNVREDSGYWFKDPNTGKVDYDAKSAAKRTWLAENGE